MSIIGRQNANPVLPPVRPAIPEAERPTLGEAFDIGRNQQRADNTNDEDAFMHRLYDPVLETLNAERQREGLRPFNNPGRVWGYGTRLLPYAAANALTPGLDQLRGVTPEELEWQIFNDIRRIRARQPGFLADVPDDPVTWRQRALEAHGRRRAEERDRLANGGRGTGVAAFAGSVAAAFEDPATYLTAPFGGGGGTALRVAARAALVNAVTTAAMQPIAASNRRRYGEELTLGEAAANVAVGAVAGAVLDGGATALGQNWSRITALPRDAQEALWARIIPHLPEALRPHMNWEAIPDSALPDVARELAGDALTADERAAADLLRGYDEAMATSPMLPTPRGEDVHIARLTATMRALLDDAPAATAVPRAAPRRAAAPARAAMANDTAIASGTVAPGRATFMARVAQAESGNGRAWANPRSSARGLYQFTDGTWLAYYARRFGPVAPARRAAVLALRSDRQLQQTLMNDLTADNARFLARMGEAESAGNLYLVHFAGQGGARRLFEAAGDAPVEQVLGDAVVRANPFLRGKSASDVIRWAHQRMNDRLPARGGARAIVDDAAGDAALLQAELDRIDAEIAALERETLGGDAPDAADLPDVPDAEPLSVAELNDLVAADPTLARVPDLPEGIDATRDAPVLGELVAADQPVNPDVISGLRKLVRTTQQSLNDVDALAATLNASADDVRRALGTMASHGEIVPRARWSGKGRQRQLISQTYQRAPRREPRNAIEEIAWAGGLRDDEGHDLMTRFQDRRGNRSIMTRFGPLVRKSGMSVDRAGELLHDSGYLSAPLYDGTMGRAGEAEVLEYLERFHHSGRGGLTPEQQSLADAAGDGRFTDEQQAAAAWLYGTDFDFDDEIVADMTDAIAAARERGEALTMDQAYVTVANERLLDEITAIWQEVADDPDYFDAVARILDESAGEGGSGRTAVPGAEGPRSDDPFDAASRHAFDERWIAGDDDALNSAALAEWSDPDGPAAASMADSIAHDLTAETPVAASGLDGAPADAPDALPTFLMDADGDPINIADLMAEHDLDADAINAIRGCM